MFSRENVREESSQGYARTSSCEIKGESSVIRAGRKGRLRRGSFGPGPCSC